jgi:hypothetical protein
MTDVPMVTHGIDRRQDGSARLCNAFASAANRAA